MKILMVTPYLPYPPASGGQIRTLNLLKYLSKRNYIVLVALYKKESDKEYVSHLKPYCNEIYLCKRPENPWQFKTILKSLISFQPFLVVRNFSQEAKRIIERLLAEEKIDVIHTETFYVMPHVPHTKVPIILVEQTIEFQVYQHFVDSLPIVFRPLLYLDIFKLRFWEKYYWKAATVMATVSEHDKKTVMQVAPSINPIVIPNGAGEDMVIEKLKPKSGNQKILLFQGNFSWLQNIEAANYLIRDIYPKLKETFPHMKLVVAGQQAKKIKKVPGVDIIDIAYDDMKTVRTLYERATLFLAPIYGPGGTRLKLLAAMACGLPIISTKTGIEGLAVKNGESVLIANSPDEFVFQVKKVLHDRGLYETLRQNAHTLILKKYNWKTIAKDLENAYKKIKP